MGIVRQGLRDIQWFPSLKTPEVLMHEHHSEADSIGQALVAKGVKLVVFGAHAANRFVLRSRTTQDVDFLCDDFASVKKQLGTEFAHLLVDETQRNLIRIAKEDGDVADFVEPVGPILPRVFKETIADETNRDERGYYYPRAEFVLAMKFSSMIHPSRAPTRQMQDAVDFANVVLGVDQRAADAGEDPAQSLDIPLLIELGNAIYEFGGAEITRHISDVRAGKRLQY